MENFLIYLWIQLKRMGKTFPSILLMTLLLTGSMVLLAHLLLETDASGEEKQKVEIGLVGDLSDSYLGFGIYAIKNMDSSRFAVEFQPMTEKEAIAGLNAGELSAYVSIPDGFMDSIAWGENKQITYVTSSGSVGLGTIIMNELAETISSLLTESQNAIYGMRKFVKENNMQDRLGKATDDMNLRYINFILNRASLYELKIIGVSNQLSMMGYYVCSIILFFLLLWGINGASLLIRKDAALPRLLAARGQGAACQVFGEYLAYLALMLASLFCIAVILEIGMKMTGFQIPEWKGKEGAVLLYFIIRIVPVAAMLSAFQLWLYETVSGMVSGILLQFLCSVCLGYLSGCFYPLYFFPESIEKLAGVLPTGVALKYMDSCLISQTALGKLAVILLYLTFFLLLAVLVRKRKIGKG
ncbi:ABC transporter permease [Anaerocolumna xylanovorans]|uniref:ABC-2 family transporter protein n=1 Tax=Anaerocolumna xylanovorans DSM 12503 TaxID=1121345 RepID=A0A1M7Y7J5_9FIRM|nr:ABC transporter permease [Anaerocolumna xylanovorans]SHO48594.1 ABC-2 family transporter protein [Anaerocolumna xylanovorans DSM 12503]